MKRIKEFIKKNYMVIILLLFIMAISINVRLTNTMDDRLSGMDPFFYASWAERVVDNDMIMPQWNEYSHYPPGRPTIDVWPAWSYTLAGWFQLNRMIDPSVSFISVAHYSIAFFSVLVVLFAFLAAWEVSRNKYGGLMASVFVTFSMMFLTRSSNGFADSDTLVFALSFFCVWATIRLIRKPSIPNYILAILGYFIFTQSWSQPFWIYIFFLATVPVLLILRVVERLRDPEKTVDGWEFITTIKSLAIVGFVSSLLTLPFNGNHLFASLTTASEFFSGSELIVTRSIAELMPSGNIWQAMIGNLGNIFYISLCGIVILLYMLYRKEKVGIGTLFLLVWFFGTLIMATWGVRYILMVTMSNAVMASFVIVKVYDIIKERIKDNSVIYLKAVFVGVVAFLCFGIMSTADSYAQSTKYAGLSQNWVDALEYMENLTNPSENKIGIATYWDFGHVINFYDFRNMFDGAQCLPKYCYPYSHTDRIQDSGRMFITSNETELIELLSKYNGLSEHYCMVSRNYYRSTFGMELPDDACDPLDEMYFLVSSDLIQKSAWLSYFGGYSDGSFRYAPSGSEDFFSHPGLCSPTGKESVWCLWMTSKNPEGRYYVNNMYFHFLESGNTTIPVYTTPIGSLIVSNVVQGGVLFDFSSHKPEAGHIDGVLLMFGDTIVYVPEALRDSMFVKTFFLFGEGMEQLEMVYQNSEIKVFKVNF